MGNSVYIDGVNVAECHWANPMANVICLSNQELCRKIQNCYFKQLQRAKAELEQYKKSKQASYEVMQEQWNIAVNELRDLKASDKIEFKQYYKAENEKLKTELEELKKYKRYKFLFEKAKEMKEQTDKWAKECLKENEDLKDSLKRTVCQAECFRYKETEKYKAENERLKAENEKLKEKIDSCNDEFGCEEMVKYRKALEEVKKYCNECNLKADYTACEVLRIIDEVLND